MGAYMYINTCILNIGHSKYRGPKQTCICAEVRMVVHPEEE